MSVALLFMVETISWSAPEHMDLSTQSIFNPLTREEIRDIGIIKYYLACLSRVFDKLEGIPGDVNTRIENEDINVRLGFSPDNIAALSSLLGPDPRGKFIPCWINNRPYFAYVSFSVKEGTPEIAVFTGEEFERVKGSGLPKTLKREGTQEKDIEHEAVTDTPLALIHGKGENITPVPEEARLRALEFLNALGAGDDLIYEAASFMAEGTTSVVPSRSEITLTIGEQEVSIPVKLDNSHASNRYMNITDSSSDDIARVLVHELSAKCGNDDDLNRALEAIFSEWDKEAPGYDPISAHPKEAQIVKNMRFADLHLVTNRDYASSASSEEDDDYEGADIFDMNGKLLRSGLKKINTSKLAALGHVIVRMRLSGQKGQLKFAHASFETYAGRMVEVEVKNGFALKVRFFKEDPSLGFENNDVFFSQLFAEEIDPATGEKTNKMVASWHDAFSKKKLDELCQKYQVLILRNLHPMDSKGRFYFTRSKPWAIMNQYPNRYVEAEIRQNLVTKIKIMKSAVTPEQFASGEVSENDVDDTIYLTQLVEAGDPAAEGNTAERILHVWYGQINFEDYKALADAHPRMALRMKMLNGRGQASFGGTRTLSRKEKNDDAISWTFAEEKYAGRYAEIELENGFPVTITPYKDGIDPERILNGDVAEKDLEAPILLSQLCASEKEAQSGETGYRILHTWNKLLLGELYERLRTKHKHMVLRNFRLSDSGGLTFGGMKAKIASFPDYPNRFIEADIEDGWVTRVRIFKDSVTAEDLARGKVTPEDVETTEELHQLVAEISDPKTGVKSERIVKTWHGAVDIDVYKGLLAEYPKLFIRKWNLYENAMLFLPLAGYVTQYKRFPGYEVEVEIENGLPTFAYLIWKDTSTGEIKKDRLGPSGYGRFMRKLYKKETDFVKAISEGLQKEGMTKNLADISADTLVRLCRDSLYGVFVKYSEGDFTSTAKGIIDLDISAVDFKPLTSVLKESIERYKELGFTEREIRWISKNHLLPSDFVEYLQRTYRLGRSKTAILQACRSSNVEAYIRRYRSSHDNAGKFDSENHLKLYDTAKATILDDNGRKALLARLKKYSKMIEVLATNEKRKIECGALHPVKGMPNQYETTVTSGLAGVRQGDTLFLEEDPDSPLTVRSASSERLVLEAWESTPPLGPGVLVYSPISVTWRVQKEMLDGMILNMTRTGLETTGYEAIDRLLGLSAYGQSTVLDTQRRIRYFNPEIPYKEYISDEGEERHTGDASQEAAVKVGLSGSRLMVIHGPPGDGKTTVITELVQHFVRQGKKVLLVSQMNAAVDRALKKIMSSDAGIPVLRLCNQSEHLLEFGTDAAWIHDDAAMQKFRAARSRSMGFVNAATDISIATDKAAASVLHGKEYDVVIMDETPRETTTGSFVPFKYLKDDGQLILVGDSRQLKPFKTREQEDILLRNGFSNEDIDSFFEGAFTMVEGMGNADEILLSTNWRSPPLLAGLSSEVFYDGEIQTRGWEDFTPDTLSLQVIDIGVKQGNTFEERVGTSFQNSRSAIKVLDMVKRYVTRDGIPPNEITIITAYRPQADTIEKMLRARFGNNAPHITTIDSFQGGENTAIIVDFVRSNLRGEIGFIKDLNRLNVALSRAKERMAIVWDSRVFMEEPATIPLRDAPARAVLRKIRDYYAKEVGEFFPEGIPKQHQSPGLIGKFVPLEPITFKYDDILGKYAARFRAINTETGEMQDIILYAQAARAGFKDKVAGTYKRTRFDEINLRLDQALADIPENNMFLLEPNIYGIDGIGTPGLFAVLERLQDSPMAQFHELGHAANIDVLPYIEGGENTLNDFISKDGKKHRQIRAMRDHYALRLFQAQEWPEENIAFTKDIQDAELSYEGAIPDNVTWAIDALTGFWFEKLGSLPKTSQVDLKKQSFERFLKQCFPLAEFDFDDYHDRTSQFGRLCNDYCANENSMRTALRRMYSIYVKYLALTDEVNGRMDNVPAFGHARFSGIKIVLAGPDNPLWNDMPIIPENMRLLVNFDSLFDPQNDIFGIESLAHEAGHGLAMRFNIPDSGALEEGAEVAANWTAAKILSPDEKEALVRNNVITRLRISARTDRRRPTIFYQSAGQLLAFALANGIRDKQVIAALVNSGGAALSDAYLEYYQKIQRFNGEKPGSGLIGKWQVVSDIEFVETDRRRHRGVLRFKAYSIEDPAMETVDIEIGAQMASPEERRGFESFKRTGIRGLDEHLEGTLSSLPDNRKFIIDPNFYGIDGIGARGTFAVLNILKNNEIAVFHEIAHLSGEDFTQFVNGGEDALEQYLSDGGQGHRKDPLLRQHYAICLLQEQKWPAENEVLSRMISAERTACRLLKQAFPNEREKAILAKYGITSERNLIDSFREFVETCCPGAYLEMDDYGYIRLLNERCRDADSGMKFFMRVYEIYTKYDRMVPVVNGRIKRQIGLENCGIVGITLTADLNFRMNPMRSIRTNIRGQCDLGLNLACLIDPENDISGIEGPAHEAGHELSCFIDEAPAAPLLSDDGVSELAANWVASQILTAEDIKSYAGKLAGVHLKHSQGRIDTTLASYILALTRELGISQELENVFSRFASPELVDSYRAFFKSLRWSSGRPMTPPLNASRERTDQGKNDPESGTTDPANETMQKAMRAAHELRNAIFDIGMNQADEKILLALDEDLGREGTEAKVRDVLREICRVSDDEELQAVLKNIIIIKGRGKNLADEAWEYASKGKNDIRIKPSNIVMITKASNEANCANFRNEAIITFVDDSKIDPFSYYPIVETLLFTVAKVLYYKRIPGYGPERLESMLKAIGVIIKDQSSILSDYIDSRSARVELEPTEPFDHTSIYRAVCEFLHYA